MICSDFETDFTILIQINRLLGAQKFYHFYAFGINSKKKKEKCPLCTWEMLWLKQQVEWEIKKAHFCPTIIARAQP